MSCSQTSSLHHLLRMQSCQLKLTHKTVSWKPRLSHTFGTTCVTLDLLPALMSEQCNRSVKYRRLKFYISVRTSHALEWEQPGQCLLWHEKKSAFVKNTLYGSLFTIWAVLTEPRTAGKSQAKVYTHSILPVSVCTCVCACVCVYTGTNTPAFFPPFPFHILEN